MYLLQFCVVAVSSYAVVSSCSVQCVIGNGTTTSIWIIIHILILSAST